MVEQTRTKIQNVTYWKEWCKIFSIARLSGYRSNKIILLTYFAFVSLNCFVLYSTALRAAQMTAVQSEH